ncbi:Pr6Pr family membrane protein [Granulicoccus sp. GXG6511]|uniref:Pr6Pr family membrane protein n=1 Tax=Granulicoccus sp. GXG6511 TaxID=3381351 RepID=UPI003D7E14D8
MESQAGEADRILHPDRAWIRALRLVVGGLVAAALIANTFDAAAGRGEVDLLQLYSYFTIQSNVIFAVVLVIGALTVRSRLPRWWDGLRGASTFYLLMTGLVYVFVVAPPEEILIWNIGWTGIIEHRFAPVVALVGWVTVHMDRRSTWARPFLWLIYPLIYLGWLLLLGVITAWYPYSFVDPTLPGGWPVVLTTIGMVTLSFIIIGVLVHLLGVLRAWASRRGLRVPARPGQQDGTVAENG